MGGASIQTAANFESSMSQVQATMGVTKESMPTHRLFAMVKVK